MGVVVYVWFTGGCRSGLTWWWFVVWGQLLHVVLVWCWVVLGGFGGFWFCLIVVLLIVWGLC